MSSIDQARCYLELKDLIKRTRSELGEDAAWATIQLAVTANLIELKRPAIKTNKAKFKYSE